MSYTKRREKKPCKRCGRERVVLVVTYPNAGAEPEDHWSPLCGVCELIRRAEVHEAQARKFRRRAAEIVTARAAASGSNFETEWSHFDKSQRIDRGKS